MNNDLNPDIKSARQDRLVYNPSLDGLRAVAVILVVFYHTRVGVFPGGFIGVDVFFVLSGYLITSILRAEVRTTGTVDLLSFYWNRLLRLYPPLILMLTAWALLIPFIYPGFETFRNGAIALFYLSDYVMAFGRLYGHLSHTWSLAVEEHFYMVWPLIILATRRLSDQQLFIGFAIFCALATTWRIVDFALWDSWRVTYYRFDTRMAGLSLGATIAVLPLRWDTKIFEKLVILALLIMIYCAFSMKWGSTYAMSLGMSVTHVVTGFIVLGVRTQSALICRLLSARPLVYIGLLSYSIYLWHFPITRVLLQHVSEWATFAIVLPVSICLAALSFTFVETPIRKFRRTRRSAVSAD